MTGTLHRLPTHKPTKDQYDPDALAEALYQESCERVEALQIRPSVIKKVLEQSSDPEASYTLTSTYVPIRTILLTGGAIVGALVFFAISTFLALVTSMALIAAAGFGTLMCLRETKRATETISRTSLERFVLQKRSGPGLPINRRGKYGVEKES